MSEPIPMIGKRFGRLTVVEDAGSTKTGQKMWGCKCDCGTIAVVRGTHLRQNKIKSCGCLRREETSKRIGTHRMKETRHYRIWKGMKARCFNPNSPAFKWYGGRGISVCEEWRNSFEAFYNHVSKLPRFGDPIYSLDRINNDGNYEPGNVRWATAKEQRHNQRCKIQKR